MPANHPATSRLLTTEKGTTIRWRSFSSPPREAAEALNISRSMIYDLIRLRAIKSVKIGKARRIPADAMRAYVTALMSDPV